ncbi:9128_t:CDS:2 [Ambispora leptoticha]|uniref:9128_t:CDS:1 n=1 Tax=Ambispora leptoticha TaxID=144679 RepID=A0A9N9B9Y0_9GLOM|nr:9128_t:CDS:2 [Ambispora leptoticha]
MSSFFQTSNGPSDFTSTFKAAITLQELSKPVQQHLVRVYITLAGLAACLAVGAYLHVNQLFLFGGGFLSFLIGLFSVIGVVGLPDTPENKYLRYGLLYNFAFMEGLSIGPLIQYTLHVDYSGSLIVKACIATSLIFVSFTLSALFSKRREYIYLGGILGSALSILGCVSILNLFLRSKILFSMELYLGLFMFCGYVLYDTQLILYRASKLGSRDVVGHSLDLFIDLVGIFVRVLIALTRNAEEKEDQKRRKRS